MVNHFRRRNTLTYCFQSKQSVFFKFFLCIVLLIRRLISTAEMLSRSHKIFFSFTFTLNVHCSYVCHHSKLTNTKFIFSNYFWVVRLLSILNDCTASWMCESGHDLSIVDFEPISMTQPNFERATIFELWKLI